MSVTFSLQRDDIINAAARKVGAVDPEGGALTTTQVTNAAQALNVMLKGWQKFGLPLWAKKIGVVFLNNAQTSYQLGVGGDKWTYASDFEQTTCPNGVSSGSTTVTLDDTTGMAAADNLGIVNQNGDIDWYVIDSIASEVVTLTSAIVTTVNADAIVYAYTTQPPFPLRVKDAYIRYYPYGNDRICNLISQEEYNRFGLKSSLGSPVNFYFDPQNSQTSVAGVTPGMGVLYLYPTPNDSTQVLFIEYQRPFEDLDAATDVPDIPDYWIEAAIYGLAVRLAPEYGLDSTERKQLIAEAEQYLETTLSFDQADGSVFLQPDQWHGWPTWYSNGG